MIKTILAAVDGSTHAEKALALAAELAQAHKAKLILLTSYSQEYTPEVMGIGMVANLPHDTEREREAAEKIVAEAAEQAGYAGAKGAITDVRRGDPATEILAAAEAHDVDMIILGSRGHGTLTGLLVGSVSTKVMSHADCTCVVVR